MHGTLDAIAFGEYHAVRRTARIMMGQFASDPFPRALVPSEPASPAGAFPALCGS